MLLFDYIADPERARTLADDLGTHTDYLYQIATERRRGSMDFVAGIVRATKGVVSLPEIWPDMADVVARSQPTQGKRKQA